MHDLHPARALDLAVYAVSSSNDVSSRASISVCSTCSAALRWSSSKTDSRSSTERVALVSWAVTRLRKSSRTSGRRSWPICFQGGLGVLRQGTADAADLARRTPG